MHFYLFLYGNLSVYRDIMISKFGGIGLIQGSADGMQLFFKGHFSKSDMFARTGLKCHLLLTLGRLKYHIGIFMDRIAPIPCIKKNNQKRSRHARRDSP